MKKTANLLFLFLFAIFLAAVPIFTLQNRNETISYFENRQLAAAPALTKQAFFDGSYFKQWETFFIDHSAGRSSAIRLDTLCQMKILRKPVINDVILTDGQLLHFYSYGSWDKPDPVKASADTAEELHALQQHICENGGEFYYVGLPCQATYFSDAYPNWADTGTDYRIALHSAFSDALKNCGIPFIDMIDRFSKEEKPLKYYTLTDHHYSFEGAFFTYRTIMERLSSDFDLPILSEDDLKVITLPNPFLGSRNRKLYGLFENSDAFSYAVLNDPIPFVRTDNGKDVPATTVTLPENDTAAVTYSAYMGGDIGETILKTNRPTLKKALIFGDSYTNALETLLYASFDETRSLDLRYYNEKSLWEYIDDYKPDIVLDIRDDSMFVEESPNGTFR